MQGSGLRSKGIELITFICKIVIEGEQTGLQSSQSEAVRSTAVSFAGFHRVPQGSTGFHRVPQGSTEFHRIEREQTSRLGYKVASQTQAVQYKVPLSCFSVSKPDLSFGFWRICVFVFLSFDWLAIFLD